MLDCKFCQIASITDCGCFFQFHRIIMTVGCRRRVRNPILSNYCFDFYRPDSWSYTYFRTQYGWFVLYVGKHFTLVYCKFNPLPDRPILGFSISVVNEVMMSKIWTNGGYNYLLE